MMIPEPLKSLRGHMHKFFVTLMASLLSCSAAFAFWPEAAESNLEVGVGYRNDCFKFTTSGRHGGFLNAENDRPNRRIRSRSEFKWKDLNVWLIELRGKYVTCDNIYLRGYADYGWITHGKHTDRREFSRSDFSSDSFSSGSFSENANNIGEVDFDGSARFHHRIKRGHVYDASLAVGYQFRWCDDSFAVSPLIGYSWHGQQFSGRHRGGSSSSDFFNDNGEDQVELARRDHHSSSSCSYDSYSSSSSDCNRNRFRACWDGFWIGFDAEYRFMCDWTLFATYEYHWADFRARARNFCIIDNFDGSDFGSRRDRRHLNSKRAYGNVFSIGGRWAFCDDWTIGVVGQFQWWDARHGKERNRLREVELSGADLQCNLSHRLRKVSWDSAGVTVDIGVNF